MKREQLWKILVRRGVFPDKDVAARWIMSGKVLVEEQVVDKAGYAVPESAAIRVKDLDKKYVGRGGLKLEGALRDFEVDVTGCVALDAGASHGGFTDCLLKHGAEKVYAVDVGYGQLAGSLRADFRVINMERRNIAEVSAEELAPLPSFAAVDLSYLSLVNAIPKIISLVSSDGLILCLVKPLFEVDDNTARRTGEINGKKPYADILDRLIRFVYEIGQTPVAVARSVINGNRGTHEFFLQVLKRKPGVFRDFLDEINAVIEPG